MQIRKINDYALRVMVNIALHQKEEGPISTVKLAKRLDLSPSYVEQLISQLRKHSLVKAKRGPRGGYMLDGHAESISMLQIITAISIKRERIHTEKNIKKDELFALPVWSQFSRHVSQFLKEITLQDLTNQAIIEKPNDFG